MEREECAARKPERAWILLKVVRDSKSGNASTAFFI